MPTINTAGTFSFPNQYQDNSDSNGGSSTEFIENEPITMYDKNTYRAELPDQNFEMPSASAKAVQDITESATPASPLAQGAVGATIGGLAGAGLSKLSPSINRASAVGAGAIIGGTAGAGRAMRQNMTQQTTPVAQESVEQKLAFYKEDLANVKLAGIPNLLARYAAPLAGAGIGSVAGANMSSDPNDTNGSSMIGTALGAFLGSRGGVRRMFNKNVLNPTIRTGRATGGAKPLNEQSFNKATTAQPPAAQAPQPTIKQPAPTPPAQTPSPVRPGANGMFTKIRGMFSSVPGAGRSQDSIPVIRSIPYKPGTTMHTGAPINRATQFRANQVAPQSNNLPAVRKAQVAQL